MRVISIFSCLIFGAAIPAQGASLSDTNQVQPQTQTQADCEDTGKAATYAADFDARMKSAVGTMKARELALQQDYEKLKSHIVAAGIWNEQAANTFMLQFSLNDPETAGFQSKRDAAAKEVKTLMYAIAGLPVVAGDDKVAQRRGLCILGQKAFSQLAIVSDSSASAWSRVIAHVTEYGKEKGVKGF